jgi:hypothetical protein
MDIVDRLRLALCGDAVMRASAGVTITNYLKVW